MLADGTALPITDPSQAGEGSSSASVACAATGLMVITQRADDTITCERPLGDTPRHTSTLSSSRPAWHRYRRPDYQRI